MQMCTRSHSLTLSLSLLHTHTHTHIHTHQNSLWHVIFEVLYADNAVIEEDHHFI
jgi:hypothetical protein